VSAEGSGSPDGLEGIGNPVCGFVAEDTPIDGTRVTVGPPGGRGERVGVEHVQGRAEIGSPRVDSGKDIGRKGGSDVEKGEQFKREGTAADMVCRL